MDHHLRGVGSRRLRRGLKQFTQNAKISPFPAAIAERMKSRSVVFSVATYVGVSLLVACSSSSGGHGSSALGGKAAGGSSSGGGTAATGGNGSYGSQAGGNSTGASSGGGSGATSMGGRASGGMVGSGGAVHLPRKSINHVMAGRLVPSLWMSPVLACQVEPKT